MNALDRMYKRIEKRDRKKNVEEKANLAAKAVYAKEIGRLFMVCGKLWEKQSKYLRKKL